MSHTDVSRALPASVLYSQNYLRDSRLVAALLRKSSLNLNDLVYEIGPGKGIITAQLARHCRRVVAVEIDPRLAEKLALQFSGWENISICADDFLQTSLPVAPYKVFANIPFNITSAILQKLTTAANPPEDAYLVMQKEAALMYQGWPRESARTLCLKPWFEMQIVHRFRRRDFTPIPGVDIVLHRLRKLARPHVPASKRQCYRDFVVYGFTTWRSSSGRMFDDLFSYSQRKRIRRELSIDLAATPTEFSFEQWLRLFTFFLDLDNSRAMQRITGSERRLQRQQTRLQKVHRTRALRARRHNHQGNLSDDNEFYGFNTGLS